MNLYLSNQNKIKQFIINYFLNLDNLKKYFLFKNRKFEDKRVWSSIVKEFFLKSSTQSYQISRNTLSNESLTHVTSITINLEKITRKNESILKEDNSQKLANNLTGTLLG